jgi:hypothetical protein
VKCGFSVCFKDLDCLQALHACNPMHSEHLHDMVMISPEVKIKGIHYIPGTVLLYNWPALSLPEFVMIRQIIVHQQNKYFHCIKLEIQEFSAHFNSFDVAETAETFVIRSDTLYNCWPQFVDKSDDHMHVMLQCTEDVWTL